MNVKFSRPFLCILMLLLMACTAPEKREPVSSTMSVEETEVARQALVEWFECEECEEGQLAAVVKYGERMVPSLRASLLEGAAPASEELLRRDLESRYDELVRYAETHPEAKVASSKEEFVAMYIGNLHAQYKTRAAQALSQIGGPTANRALQEGLERADRPDVRATVEAAIKSAKK
ncbi:MAG TPA: hypothetical protein VGQ36_06865 [Thermoanaerobaculia bacterium]|nr:hypothetical protein [Thermoanaerobaculia bacterium]